MFVASQMAPALYKILEVNIKNKDDKYWLRANGFQQLFAGFLAVDHSQDKAEGTLLPELNEGYKVELITVYLE